MSRLAELTSQTGISAKANEDMDQDPDEFDSQDPNAKTEASGGGGGAGGSGGGAGLAAAAAEDFGGPMPPGVGCPLKNAIWSCTQVTRRRPTSLPPSIVPQKIRRGDLVSVVCDFWSRKNKTRRLGSGKPLGSFK